MARRTNSRANARTVDPQRIKRYLPKLGRGLKYTRGDAIELDLKGALAFDGNGVTVEVEAPLASSSPIRLELGSSVEVRNGKIEAKPFTAGDGVTIDRNRKVSVRLDTDALEFVDSVVTPKGASAIADLDLSVTMIPTQAEVQAIADKLDTLLAALRETKTIQS